jgi:hypothetical protein
MLSGFLAAVLIVGTLSGSVDPGPGGGCFRTPCYLRYDRGYCGGCGGYCPHTDGGCGGYDGCRGVAPMMAITNITATAAMMNMSGEMAMIGPAVPDSHRRSFPE